MKILIKLFLIILLLLGQNTMAQDKSILVVPADLYNICNNYYCFSEASEIIASDTIKNINGSGKLSAPNLYVVKAKIINDNLKDMTVMLLNEFKKENKINYETVQMLSKNFGVNNVLLISSSVISEQNNSKHGLWEILEISSSFNAVYPFKLETKALLIDAENGIVVWKGTYIKTLSNRENTFWARNSSQANGWLENIRMYSKNIVSREISQSVILKFFPKTLERSNNENSEQKMDGSFFRINKGNPAANEPQKETNEDFGEILYGI